MKKRSIACAFVLVSCAVACGERRETVVVHDRGEPNEEIVEREPPADRVEEVGTPPSGEHVWIHGNWVWSGGAYVWRGGRWEVRRAGHEWTHGHWQRRGRGHVWVEGRWRRI